MSEDVKKAALNAVELLERWTGDTVVPFSDFRVVHQRAVNLNVSLVKGELVCLTEADYKRLLADSNELAELKKRRRRK